MLFLTVSGWEIPSDTMFWSQEDSVYQTLRGKGAETLLAMQRQHSTTESEMLVPPLAPASLLTSWLATFGWQVLKAKKIRNLLFRTAGRIIFLQTYLFNILNLLFIWSFSIVKKKKCWLHTLFYAYCNFTFTSSGVSSFSTNLLLFYFPFSLIRSSIHDPI